MQCIANRHHVGHDDYDVHNMLGNMCAPQPQLACRTEKETERLPLYFCKLIYHRLAQCHCCPRHSAVIAQAVAKCSVNGNWIQEIRRSGRSVAFPRHPLACVVVILIKWHKSIRWLANRRRLRLICILITTKNLSSTEQGRSNQSSSSCKW